MSMIYGSGGKRPARRVLTSTVLALVTAALIIAILLSWSASRTDSVSFERQEQMVRHSIQQSIVQIASELETRTVLDTAIEYWALPEWKTENVPEELLKLTDHNIGFFNYRFYGHDELYVLSGDDRPLYAMRDGKRRPRHEYEQIESVADPLVSSVRARMRQLQLTKIDRNSPGAADIAIMNGHPAIVSVKPVVSPTGERLQKPGNEPVFIGVRRLDGNFITRLSSQYLLQGVRFSTRVDHAGNENSLPILSPRTQATVGYLIWQPYTPGSKVLRDMILPLMLGLLVVCAVTWLLVRRVQRSTVQLQASEAQARHLAFHDVLTGLPNRALFDDRLDRALAATRRHHGEFVALLYLDLDRFKKVNDTLGHPAGDQLIREVGSRLTGAVRACDTVARLGGDEFAIIQTGVHSDNDIKMLCERIIEAVEAPFDLVGSQVFVGMSIGVARSGHDGFDRTEMSRKADIALYDAKFAGRGRYTIFAEAMDATIQARRSIEGDLREALEAGDQLRVCYQPKYAAGSLEVLGVEALVRWEHPTRGRLSPVMFIPIAEETGVIEQLGEWVLEEACAAAANWPVQTLSVNASAVQLRNPLFAQKVLKILHKTGFAAGRLEIEITETSFMESIELCIPNLKSLRALGVRIALDDFGTGYSSFNHLRSFEVDRIKIDQSFIKAIGSSHDSNAIIHAIVDLAHAIGIQITAEGVETDHQSSFLCSAGCDELQGFLMSRPLSLKDTDTLFGIDPALRVEHIKPLAA